MHDTTVTRNLLSYIEENLEQNLTLGKIAQDLHYSKFYIARTFKNDTGITLYQYIRNRRLSEAAWKLVKTGKTLAEISYEAGYHSQQAFTQAFHGAYASTPQSYRKTGIFFPKQIRIELKSDTVNKLFSYLSTEREAAA